MISVTYTDDIMELGDTAEGLSMIRKELAARYHLSREGEFKYMLGIMIEQNRCVVLSVPGYGGT